MEMLRENTKVSNGSEAIKTKLSVKLRSKISNAKIVLLESLSLDFDFDDVGL